MINENEKNGFMMVELIISLAIISMSLIVFLSLKNDILRRQSMQKAAMSKIALEANGLALLRRINPATEPSGRREIGLNSALAWRSKQLGRSRRVLKWLGRETSQKVNIYNVDYTISSNGKSVTGGSVQLIGRKK